MILSSAFVNGAETTTLPLKVYSSVKVGVTPQVNALCTVMLGAAFLLVAVGQLASSALERRRKFNEKSSNRCGTAGDVSPHLAILPSLLKGTIMFIMLVLMRALSAGYDLPHVTYHPISTGKLRRFLGKIFRPFPCASWFFKV